MKRIVVVLIAVLLVVVFTGCSKKGSVVIQVDPTAEDFDWDAARKSYLYEISSVLRTLTAGEAYEWVRMRDEWAGRVPSPVHFDMFMLGQPPENCSSIATFVGYSPPHYNSFGAEFAQFTVQQMNNATLASVSWRVVVSLGRDDGGYYISDFQWEGIR